VRDRRSGRRLALALAAAVAPLLWPLLPAHATSPGAVVIELDRAVIATHVGDRFTFRSTIRNPADRPLENLVAHLNVLSLDPDVYVDPEDWSSERTQYLAGIAAGGSTTVSWTVRAVNEGRIVLYVAVASQRDREEIDASAALRATVTARQKLSARGVLPIAFAVPALFLVLLVATLRRRRRLA
jgi:hypothetical protein